MLCVVLRKLTIVLHIKARRISYAVTTSASRIDYVVGKVHGAAYLAHAVAIKIILKAKRI